MGQVLNLLFLDVSLQGDRHVSDFIQSEHGESDCSRCEIYE